VGRIQQSYKEKDSEQFLPWGLLVGAILSLVGLNHEHGDDKTSPARFFRSSHWAENCGIVGVVGAEDAREVLLEGLQILKNRGYDSAGIATLSPERGLVSTKYASRSAADSVDLLTANSSKHAGHSMGIGHTRWATHGGKTDLNAHPHMDQHGRVALVHNGTINNATELRRELIAQGIKFSSETDTEIIAQLVGLYLDSETNLRAAVAKALSRCDGTWGLAVICKDKPDEIVVACNGSPLMIGIGQGKIFIASETSAFNRFTKNFIAMKDREIGTVSAAGCSLDISRVQLAPEQQILLKPDPYPNWTLREMMEQPEAVSRALGYGGRMAVEKVFLGGMDRNRERLEKIEHLIISACGTSLYAGMYGAKLMRSFGAFRTASAFDSAEIRAAEIPDQDGGLMVISQSGETKDVHRAVKIAQDLGVPVISIVNSVGSLIARETQLGVYLNAGRENSVASTKAFTTQVTVLGLLAMWFSQVRQERTPRQHKSQRQLFEALQRLPISVGMALRLREQCKGIAAKLLHKEHCFVLGKGYGEPVAFEGALKLKEMSYLHAEGFSGGALKHGPFALIEGEEGKHGKTPVILLILQDEHATAMRTAAMELKARNAELYVITDNRKLAEGLDDNPVVIPSNGPLTALIGVLPLQLIAYELGIMKGINPDTPRNLAKAVTVD